MTDSEAAVETVTLPAWSIHLVPVEHPRPWRLTVVSAGMHAPAVQLDRVAVHLTEAEVAALAQTLLCPRHPQEPQPGRARVVRDGFGLLLRVVVHPIDREPGVVAHIGEHHRRVLLDDIGRHRPDLIPATTPPEPRLCLDPTPVTGLTIDQVAELHGRLGRGLASDGIRAAIADRIVRRRIHDQETNR
ncbi:hypothetical protein ACIRL2_43470 [Embleya sp. NPDC127516]|uniref:hypothetical protein n=1 Tax=Embleya sp. NPDC127516 TaxID=3363990 RepID=UPI0038089AA3